MGDYQNILFIEAARVLKLKHPGDVLFILVTYLPIPSKLGEMKTKPTQNAVRSLNSYGVQPDIIIARSASPLDAKRKEKLAIWCNVPAEAVVSAPDIESIYEVPLNFEKDKLGDNILKTLSLRSKGKDLKEWKALVDRMAQATKKVKIGIVGKYFGTGNFVLTDAYISVLESIKHAGAFWKVKPELTWIDPEDFEKNASAVKMLSDFDGIIVPGGFGSRGVEGKIKAIEHCRKNKIPFLGLCLGLQLSVIEFARNVAGIKDATSREFDKNAKNPVIDVMEEQKSLIKEKKYGGTMRLGSYDCQLKPKTISRKAYGADNITERHRHRYEVNNNYRKILEEKGMVMAGINPNKNLVEIIELPGHPFFVGTQFHPEFKSRPLSPHPLFREFIKATIK